MSVEFKRQLFIQIIWTIWQKVSCIIIKLINSKNLINYLKLMNFKNNNKKHLCYIMSNAIIAFFKKKQITLLELLSLHWLSIVHMNLKKIVSLSLFPNFFVSYFVTKHTHGLPYENQTNSIEYTLYLHKYKFDKHF